MQANRERDKQKPRKKFTQMRPYQYHAVFGTQQKTSAKCTDSNPLSDATTLLLTVSRTLIDKSGKTQ